jgi:hypothetical protein
MTKSLNSSTIPSLEDEEDRYRIKASVAFAAGAGMNGLMMEDASLAWDEERARCDRAV